MAEWELDGFIIEQNLLADTCDRLFTARTASAAWKASAKKYRKAYSSHLSPADDYFKREEYFVRAESAEKRVAELEFALRKARLELGVPQENYPAPIVEAWMIIDAALNKSK